ncbi:helix-turn-helix transcriptional regulator [Serratia marcescens]|uniref:response regulator transcription factor n=1 Tax=Serratia marcescens TaxID=615 RepID=UPI0039B368F3
MNTPVYIGLFDRDSFFLKGLRFLLWDYFSSKNKRIFFVDENEVKVADVIFYESSNSMAYFIGDALRTSNKNAIVFPLGESEKNLSTWRLACFQQVLSKKTRLQDLTFYLDVLWREREVFGYQRRVCSPEEELTGRQRQIMRLLAKGIAPADISARLNISIKTVSSHRGAVMKKFGFNRKIELYNWLILRGNEL